MRAYLVAATFSKKQETHVKMVSAYLFRDSLTIKPHSPAAVYSNLRSFSAS